ncbi:MAG: hypothetical protein HZB51_09125 [Chloroflexi bacterium]|nr:hypothetical protein [Chloroflexota bacterium]
MAKTLLLVLLSVFGFIVLRFTNLPVFLLIMGSVATVVYFFLTVVLPWNAERNGKTNGQPYRVHGFISLILLLAIITSSALFFSLWYFFVRYEPPPPFGGHTGQVAAMVFDPAANQLASGGMDTVIRLWNANKIDPNKSALVSTFPANVPFYLVYSPDGSLIAIGSADGTIRIWNVETESLIKQLYGHSGDVAVLAFSPDGSLLASGGKDKAVRLWRVSDWALLKVFDAFSQPITGLAFDSMGKMLAVGSADRTVRVIQTDSYAVVRSMTVHGEAVAGVSLKNMPDGLHLITVSVKGVLRRWRIADGAMVQQLMYGSAESNITSVAFSHNGELFAQGDDENKTIRVCTTIESPLAPNTPTPTPSPRLACKITINKQGQSVKSLAFDPSDTKLAAGYQDKTIRLWNLNGNDANEIRSFNKHENTINGLAFSPNGQNLASVSADKTVRIWKFDDDNPLYTFQGEAGEIEHLAFNRDATSLVSMSDAAYVRTWQVEEGNSTLLYEQSLKPDTLTALAVHPIDGTIAVGNSQGAVQLLMPVGVPNKFQPFKHEIPSLAYRPAGNVLAIASVDQPIRLWTADGKSQLAELDGQKGRITHMLFSDDGKILASASEDNTVRLWFFPDEQTVSMTQTIELPMTSSETTALVFTKDNQVLLTGTADGMVRLWNTRDGSLIEEIRGYAQPVMVLGVNGNGVILAAGARGVRSEIQLWSPGTVQEIRDPFSFYSIKNLLLGTELTRLFGSILLGLTIATTIVLLPLWQISNSAAKVMFEQYPGFDRDKAQRAIFDMRLGINKAHLLIDKEGQVKSARPAAEGWARLGGPGILIVEEGFVAVLAKSGKISRVVPAGITWLQAFERVAMPVYLAPRSERIVVTDATTQDKGMLSEFSFLIFHRADPGDRSRVSGQYCYDPSVILNKIWSPSGGDWRIAVKSMGASVARDLIAQYKLEDLVSIAGEERQQLIFDLKNRLNARTLPLLGVEVIAADIGVIVAPQAVQREFELNVLTVIRARTRLIDKQADRHDLLPPDHVQIQTPLPAQLTIDSYINDTEPAVLAIDYIYSVLALVNAGDQEVIARFVQMCRDGANDGAVSNSQMYRFLAAAGVEPLKLAAVHYGSLSSFSVLGIDSILLAISSVVKDLAWRGK